MQVGTVVQLKRECFGNKAGAIGVVFYKYEGGFQAIFENGGYDGFSYATRFATGETEADFFLHKIGFCEDLAGYHFKNILRVEDDYRRGVFAKVLQKREYTTGAAV